MTLLGGVISCASPAVTWPTRSKETIILATTTSIQDSGLLDVLIPRFEKETGYAVKTVAVGSGQALRMGEEGNADVLFVHSPAAEKPFMEKGWGRDRALVMHNDFLLVGPPNDPARIRGLSPVEAFRAIAASGAPFLSRGDGSGTHSKERDLWQKAGIEPTNAPWYLESGQGMGATLTIASEKGAYTLTDRATYVTVRAHLPLEILVEGDPALLNVYHVITVNPAKHPEVNYAGALAFLRFMTAPETQRLIGDWGVREYGQPLFTPDAGKTDADLGL